MQHKRTAHTTSGITLIRKLAEEGVVIFSTKRVKELAPMVSLKLSYISQALHYLTLSGWIIRIKNGLYALSSNVFGSSPLHEFTIAMQLAQPAAISHWSAFNYHGLSEQIPMHVFMLTTTGSAPRSKLGGTKQHIINGITYQIIQIKNVAYFGITEAWINNNSKVKITDLERTLLDGLMSPQYCGDFPEVINAFKSNIARINITKIIDYALKLDTATAKRLGWVLDTCGIPSDELAILKNLPIKGYRPLDPSGPKHGTCDKKWMVQLNLPGNRIL